MKNNMKYNITHANLVDLVPMPGAGYDWALLCEAIPSLLALENTSQDPIYHAEGNVGIHTRMVLDALLEDHYFQSADGDRRFILFVSALLHDIAKPITTRVDEQSGRISQPGHSRKGAIDARILLWYAGTPFATREAICRIIAEHQVPFFAFASRSGESPQRIARCLSWKLHLPDLVCVARADMRGRTFHGKDACLQDIELFQMAAQEDGCWDGRRFAVDAHTRLSYARGLEIQLDAPYFQPDGSKVTLLSGLPASGKDTWVARHAADLPVVSFDNAKAELGLKHGENDGQAAHHAIDMAKALLRFKKPFVFNATHLSQQMRDKSLDLLFAYQAEVRLVYLETTPAAIFQRNRNRDTTLRNADIERMLHRWEVPVSSEAHCVEYEVGHATGLKG
ncbi:MAG TPA: AAA family ATPase [Burkholderiaceae bacterium]|jgi:predicted kinase